MAVLRNVPGEDVCRRLLSTYPSRNPFGGDIYRCREEPFGCIPIKESGISSFAPNQHELGRSFAISTRPFVGLHIMDGSLAQGRPTAGEVYRREITSTDPALIRRGNAGFRVKTCYLWAPPEKAIGGGGMERIELLEIIIQRPGIRDLLPRRYKGRLMLPFKKGNRFQDQVLDRQKELQGL